MDKLDIHAAVISIMDHISALGMEALALVPLLTPEAAAKIESVCAVLEKARRRAGQGFPLYPA